MHVIELEWLEPSNSTQETLDRLHNYSDFRKIMRLDGTIIKLDELQKLINKGEKVFVKGKDDSEEKTIYCKLSKKDPWSKYIPYVHKSNHERFTKGKRFDYGFMHVSLGDGYSIKYNF